MDLESQIRQQVAEGLARIKAKGLAGESRAVLSARIPGQNAMAVGAVAGTASDIAILPFDQAAVAEPICAAHAAVFRTRGDAGAVLTAQQPWAMRLRQLSGPMPAVFDEQVRQLGQRVETLPVEGSRLGETGAGMLRRGGHAFLLGDGVLVIGFTPERVVLNAELLEKCAKAYLLASLTGCRLGRIPWLVRFIAGRRLRKDQQRAAESFARGELPGHFATY